jgi:hypothetical protein
MHISRILLALTAATLLTVGCAKQRGPATDALKSVETSLEEVRADAAKYAPDGLKGVESQLERLKASLEQKEYENVLAGTPQLQKAVASLRDAVAAGKAEAKAKLAAAKSEWENLNTEVPKLVDAIQARIAELDKRKIRLKVSKEEVESAKSGLEWMKSEWAEATAAATSGNDIEAAEKARAVKAKAEELQKTLEMKNA